MYLAAKNLESGERRIVVEDRMGGRYFPTGHIVYSPMAFESTKLLVVAFDFSISRNLK